MITETKYSVGRALTKIMPGLFMAGALLTSCAQEDMPESADMPLPGGEYPIILSTAGKTAPAGSPQTRVADSDDGTSSWTAGDRIRVTVSPRRGTATPQQTFCTLDADGNITAYDPQLYWQSTGDYTVNASYSNIAGQATVASGTVSLADQSAAPAYVLKAAPLTANYKSPQENLRLTFSHQLAKVRVKLTGELAAGISDVKVKGYTSCTVDADGTVKEGSGLSYIVMHRNGEYYEASLVPQTGIDASDFIRLNDGAVRTTISDVTETEAGRVYSLTIEVKPKEGVFDLEGNPVDPDNIDTDVIVTGNIDVPLTIRGTHTMRLVNASFNVNANNGSVITVASGSPTIIVDGANRFDSTERTSFIVADNENCDINVIGQNNGSMVITNSFGNMLAGAMIGGRAYSKAGNITVKDLTLEVSLNRGTNGAIIGSGIANSCVASCGDITIDNVSMTVSSNKKLIHGAYIGTGLSQVANASNSCGNITITLKPGQTKEEFLSTLESSASGLITQKPQKVGIGGIYNNGAQSCGTITWLNSDGTPAE